MKKVGTPTLHTSTFFYILCTKYLLDEFVVWARYSFSPFLCKPSLLSLHIFDFWFYFLENAFFYSLSKSCWGYIFFYMKAKLVLARKYITVVHKKTTASKTYLFMWQHYHIFIFNFHSFLKIKREGTKSHIRSPQIQKISFWNTKWNLFLGTIFQMGSSMFNGSRSYKKVLSMAATCLWKWVYSIPCSWRIITRRFQFWHEWFWHFFAYYPSI